MSDENLRTAYQELCTSYHGIDAFRTKLLGFLPLVTGVGLGLLTEFLKRSNVFEDTNKTPPSLLVALGYAGIFGIVVTLGLFAYEIYGIKKCHSLILTGQGMEIGLGVVGQFRSRPREAFHFINEPFAAAIIYPATLAAWTYVASFFLCPVHARATAIAVFFAFFGFVILFGYLLKHGVEWI